MAVRVLRNSWWVDFRFDHTRYRMRSPENSRIGAQAYEAQLRHKLARGETISGAPNTDPQQRSFEQFARQWFDDYVVPNNKFSERKAKRHILTASLIPFFGKLPIGGIRAHHVEQYKAQQIRAGVGCKTINNRLTVLNKCLGTAHDWLEIETPPPKIKKLKCPPVQTDYLTRDESERLLSHADGVLHEMLLTTLRTGMRQGELKGLQWQAIDWANGTLTVRHSWNDEIKVLESPKSNRERVIPLSLEVRDVLVTRKRAAGFVFLDGAGKPFSGKRLNRRLAALAAKVGLRRITWHALRHTFATHLTTMGVAPNTVQSLLGHASIATTMRYAHVPPGELTKAVNLLSNLGQPVGNRTGGVSSGAARSEGPAHRNP